MLKRRPKFRRKHRARSQTFSRLLPNIITVGALCAGLTGVRFAIAGQWEFAMVAILVAAVLDAPGIRVVAVRQCDGRPHPGHLQHQPLHVL